MATTCRILIFRHETGRTHIPRGAARKNASSGNAAGGTVDADAEAEANACDDNDNDDDDAEADDNEDDNDNSEDEKTRVAMKKETKVEKDPTNRVSNTTEKTQAQSSKGFFARSGATSKSVSSPKAKDTSNNLPATDHGRAEEKALNNEDKDIDADEDADESGTSVKHSILSGSPTGLSTSKHKSRVEARMKHRHKIANILAQDERNMTNFLTASLPVPMPTLATSSTLMPPTAMVNPLLDLASSMHLPMQTSMQMQPSLTAPLVSSTSSKLPLSPTADGSVSPPAEKVNTSTLPMWPSASTLQTINPFNFMTTAYLNAAAAGAASTAYPVFSPLQPFPTVPGSSTGAASLSGSTAVAPLGIVGSNPLMPPFTLPLGSDPSIFAQMFLTGVGGTAAVGAPSSPRGVDQSASSSSKPNAYNMGYINANIPGNQLGNFNSEIASIAPVTSFPAAPLPVGAMSAPSSVTSPLTLPLTSVGVPALVLPTTAANEVFSMPTGALGSGLVSPRPYLADVTDIEQDRSRRRTESNPSHLKTTGFNALPRRPSLPTGGAKSGDRGVSKSNSSESLDSGYVTTPLMQELFGNPGSNMMHPTPHLQAFPNPAAGKSNIVRSTTMRRDLSSGSVSSSMEHPSASRLSATTSESSHSAQDLKALDGVSSPLHETATAHSTDRIMFVSDREWNGSQKEVGSSKRLRSPRSTPSSPTNHEFSSRALGMDVRTDKSMVMYGERAKERTQSEVGDESAAQALLTLLMGSGDN